MSILNGEQLVHIYEMQHSHIIPVEDSDFTSAFPLLVDIEYDEPFDRVIDMLFTKHLRYQRLEFTGQHYTMVAEHLMASLNPPWVFGLKSCYSCADQCHYFSLCQSADEFHMADDKKKREHSENLSVLLCIAHLLPLARKSDAIMGYIFHTEDRSRRQHGPRNLHTKFTLNRWNDHIIQPARDAVLDYYKVRTPYPTYAVHALIFITYSLNQRYAEPSDLEEYMRLNNLS